jgi:hypothetical protein
VAGDTDELQQLRQAIGILDTLSQEEYGATIAEVLSDSSCSQEDRLWRVGRLVGITVKKPFAKDPTPIDDPSQSKTGARRVWALDPESLERPAEDLWQYRLVSGLLSDRSLRGWTYLGPDPNMMAGYVIHSLSSSGKVPDDLASRLQQMLHVDAGVAESAAQHISQRTTITTPTLEEMTDWLWADLSTQLQSPWHVAVALNEMQNERGFWRCMAKSAARFMCGDQRFQAAIEESARTGGIARGMLSPQAMIGASSVEAANALNNTVPWMNPSTAIVTTGFLIIIGNVGLSGFCDWVAQYVSVAPETPDIES